MAKSALQAAKDLASEHGIKIEMTDDYMMNAVVVRGRIGEGVDRYECKEVIDRVRVLGVHPNDVENFYAAVHRRVIAQLLEARGGRTTSAEVAQLQADLARYKDAVKKLSFDLEMAKTGRAVVSEAAIRKAALEQAAEFLMDHGVITSGGELETVCEQIKKLHPTQGMRAAPKAGTPFFFDKGFF